MTFRKDATLSDIEHFHNIYPGIELFLFFGQSPAHFCNYHNYIDHNIRSYTLYKLANEGKIKLQSFDSSAALSSLKIDANIEVLTPSTGFFVLTITSDAGKEIELVLELERHPHNVEWTIYIKSSADFSVFDKLIRNSLKECNYYEGKVFDQNGKFLNLPDVSFDDIYLDETLRQEIKTNVIDYLDKKLLEIKRKNGIPTKRGVVFTGDPGTGKTFLSRVLAKTLNTTFIVVTEVHHAEDIQGVFNLAKKFERVVILFEDIDIYVKSRHLTNSLLPTLLNLLDGVEVNNHTIVLCTTNNVEVMDKAMNDRPGRFDRILRF